MTNPLLSLIPHAAPPPPVRKWATVTNTAPLQIIIDNETDALAAAPASLVPVHAGDRVYVEIAERRATIIGKSAAMVDSGVISLTPQAPFDAPMGEGSNIARYGNQVTCSLIVSTSAAAAIKDVVMTIPSGFRPPFALYPASYANAANVGIYPSGAVVCYSALAKSAPLRITASWYTNEPAPGGIT